LEIIGIVMDVTIPVVLLPDNLRSPDCKTRHLDVGDSRISDPSWVAAFISGVFANQDFVECGYYGQTIASFERKLKIEPLAMKVGNLVFATVSDLAASGEKSWFSGDALRIPSIHEPPKISPQKPAGEDHSKPTGGDPSPFNPFNPDSPLSKQSIESLQSPNSRYRCSSFQCSGYCCTSF
jgi:hypothetical protein